MFVRLAPVAIVAALTAVACDGVVAPDTRSGGGAKQEETSESEVKRGAKGESEGEESTKTKDGKGAGPSEPADPACVATCNTRLKAKCEGDDDFCEGLCGWITTAELTCMASASSCEKSEFFRCQNETAGDAGAK